MSCSTTYQGLVGVAATDVGAKIDAAITRAKKHAKARLQADTDALRRISTTCGRRSCKQTRVKK